MAGAGDDAAREVAALREERAKLAAQSIEFDRDLYGAGGGKDAFLDSIAPGGEDEDDEGADDPAAAVSRKLASYTAPKSVLGAIPTGEPAELGNVRTSASAPI